jgi:hypothetical protein
LFKVKTIDLSKFLFLGLVGRIHLEDTVLTALLGLQDLKSIVIIIRGNDTIRDLTGDDLGSDQINLVGKGNKVTERRHTISTTSTGISVGKRGQGELQIIDLVDLLFNVRKFSTNGGTGRRDVLERGGSGETGGLLELLDQTPRVQGIQKVDVTRRATQDGDRQLGLLGVDLSRALVRVGTITKGHHGFTLGVLLTEVVGDGLIIVRGRVEGLQCKTVTCLLGDFTGLELSNDLGVVKRVRDDGNTSVVLGSSTE